MLAAAIALYERLVLGRPVAALLITSLLVGLFGWFTPQFRLDASADSLVLEHDPDLRYYRSIRARYGTDDYLIVTYSPHAELFSADVLADLRLLRDQLAALERVDQVVSLLDVPLLESPPLDLRELPEGIRYLEQPEVDRASARRELIHSPLYRKLIISPDGRTTALRVDFVLDETYRDLRDRRDHLREQELSGELDAPAAAELAVVSEAFRVHAQTLLEQERRDIAAVREVMARHTDTASLHLGGVPMIVADSIAFIRHDLLVFGIAVVVFLVLILAIAFGKARWVSLPLLTCAATGIVMVGYLGLVDWRVTVLSSNFLSLLLILNLALTLHLIVRYREHHRNDPDADQLTLVSRTVRSKTVACLYTALTTMVAFGSLLVSGVRPVIDFGWMMTLGLVVAFLLSFVLLPAGLMLLTPGEPSPGHDLTDRITAFFARLIHRHSRATLAVFALATVVCVIGATRLTVENRFIDYYKQSTEIYQGMGLIDRELGGTTPLDVIIDAPLGTTDLDIGLAIAEDDAFAQALAAEFEQEFADETGGITSTSYWFNSHKLPTVARIHDFLDGRPETGKVLSLATVAEVLNKLDAALPDDDFLLSIVYQRLPDTVRADLIEPYLSADGDQLRFALRVFESDPTLRRQQLLDAIRSYLTGDLGLAPEQVHLTGMLVLYNNMLKSLFRSQILTLGAVFIAILIMFMLLFRSPRLALIALVPNVVSGIFVLGLMGWLRIPLDMMTITIAAITIGISVDDTIHYVCRFRNEFAIDRDYWPAIHRCHGSIGRAMYYTTVTITMGFSILALSNFVPTIYFGLLIGCAMIVALLADLTLLPALLVVCRGGRGTFRAADLRTSAMQAANSPEAASR
ncbi:MAG: MMPL family transporter [Gammaproteobacteria bacterium]